MNMKFAIVVLAVLVSCQALSDEEAQKQWNEFQVKFERTYRSPLESRRRFTIFKENLEQIEAHNVLYKQGAETYEQGVTPFTDWTAEEFLQYVNKYKMEPRKAGSEIFKANSTLTAPASIDWRDYGAVREVKNQGSCGSCWSFSATGAMEGLATLRQGTKVSLSEQNLINCAGATYGNHGCNGGNMDGAFLYVSQSGVDTEANQPYQGNVGSCRPAPSGSFRIRSYTDVAQDETSLKEAVGSVGPVSVGIEATSNLQNYRGGVIYDSSCSNKLNHGVLAVGYGTDNGQDYWLIKNSWGGSWGEAGYFRLARNRGNNCGVALMASYPTL